MNEGMKSPLGVSPYVPKPFSGNMNLALTILRASTLLVES